jgi:hypothetical protein
MVNTVGSCKTYWQRNWVNIKQNLILSEKQRKVIIGSLLGDGTMNIGKKGKNANFKVEQGLAQKEYTEWKYEILKPWVSTEPKISFRYHENGEKYAKSWWFRTVRHPILTKLHNEFYVTRTAGRKKILPNNLSKEIDPLVLAVWIMDDGCFTNNRIDISTYSFSLLEIQSLQEIFRDIFELKALFYKDRDKGFRLYFNQAETKKLIPIISPYIISSMRYKIGFATP